jgi:beta-lactam-binding protein with PASTA domain
MKRFLRALTEKRFWIHLILVAITVFAIVQITLIWLGSYTRHGESITVPDLTGMDLNQVEEILDNRDLTFLVTDSVHTDAQPVGAVISQNPAGSMEVKKGRTIFLTVSRVLPEMVEMPDLTAKSLRIAIPLLEIAGLKLDVLEYKPDDTCTDCILGFKLKGKDLEPGEMIQKGEKITLVLGRESNVETTIPSLLGRTYNSSVELLLEQSLNIGEILVCQGCSTSDDSANAVVFNQLPARGQMAKLGSVVDVYLTTDSTIINSFEILPDSTNYEMD